MAETIATTTMTLKASENIKLNPPKPFTGKRSNFILFMQDVYVYLKVKWLIYNDDEKKISFILSYLAEGDATVWKQQFIQTKIEESEEAKTDEPNWGMYKEFVDALKKTFQPYNEPAEALKDIKKLHLGNGSITEHNSSFQLLVSQTGMKDSPALTDLYREMLHWGLQSPIIRSEHPPKTLEEWYTKATNFYIRHCYDFKQCVWVKPVLAFGTERNSIVNSRGLSSERSKDRFESEFGEHLKECHYEVVLS
jgi:Retrotransposon gag protein